MPQPPANRTPPLRAITVSLSRRWWSNENLMAVQFHPEKSGEVGSRVLRNFRGVGAMTLARRIIPCLDVDAGRVVKGVEFTGLRDMGDPGRTCRALQRAKARMS